MVFEPPRAGHARRNPPGNDRVRFPQVLDRIRAVRPVPHAAGTARSKVGHAVPAALHEALALQTRKFASRMNDDRWASFCSSIDAASSDFPHPKGYAVGEALVAGLRQRNVDGKLENWRDAGWSIDCTVKGTDVYVVVSYLGQREREWILHCTSDVGVLARLFGTDDAAAKLSLAHLVSDILGNDSRFSNVRWYPSGWRGRGDEEWTQGP